MSTLKFSVGTPMIVQSMVIYYGTAQAFGINLDRTLAAIFIVSINTVSGSAHENAFQTTKSSHGMANPVKQPAFRSETK